MRRRPRRNPRRPKLLSLFDLSGQWAEPWREDGRFDVFLFDRARSAAEDINLVQAEDWDDVAVVLAAPPCTLLTKVAAQWRHLHTDEERAAALGLIERTLALVRAWRPGVWALENPPGLASHLFRGREVTKLVFQPWEYAGWLRPDDPSLRVRGVELRDRYSKATAIWGAFDRPRKDPLERLDRWGRHTAITWVPPGPQRACIRSRTPLGFARAFYESNVERALAAWRW